MSAVHLFLLAVSTLYVQAGILEESCASLGFGFSPVALNTSEAPRSSTPVFMRLWCGSPPSEHMGMPIPSVDGFGFITLYNAVELFSSIGGDPLVLYAVRVRIPAEHVLDGVRHDVEVQLQFFPQTFTGKVQRDSSSSLTVSQFYSRSQITTGCVSTGFVQAIVATIPASSEQPLHSLRAPLCDLLNDGEDIIFYRGNTTTQAMIWAVRTNVQCITSSAFLALSSRVPTYSPTLSLQVPPQTIASIYTGASSTSVSRDCLSRATQADMLVANRVKISQASDSHAILNRALHGAVSFLAVMTAFALVTATYFLYVRYHMKSRHSETWPSDKKRVFGGVVPPQEGDEEPVDDESEQADEQHEDLEEEEEAEEGSEGDDVPLT